jgi:hypothetical protein
MIEKPRFVTLANGGRISVSRLRDEYPALDRASWELHDFALRRLHTAIEAMEATSGLRSMIGDFDQPRVPSEAMVQHVHDVLTDAVERGCLDGRDDQERYLLRQFMWALLDGVRHACVQAREAEARRALGGAS